MTPFQITKFSTMLNFYECYQFENACNVCCLDRLNHSNELIYFAVSELYLYRLIATILQKIKEYIIKFNQAINIAIERKERFPLHFDNYNNSSSSSRLLQTAKTVAACIHVLECV